MTARHLPLRVALSLLTAAVGLHCAPDPYSVNGKTFQDGAERVRPVAARDLHCPAEQLSFHQLGSSNVPVWVADGCGQRATYLRAWCLPTGTCDPPGFSDPYVMISHLRLEPAAPSAPSAVP